MSKFTERNNTVFTINKIAKSGLVFKNNPRNGDFWQTTHIAVEAVAKSMRLLFYDISMFFKHGQSLYGVVLCFGWNGKWLRANSRHERGRSRHRWHGCERSHYWDYFTLVRS